MFWSKYSGVKGLFFFARIWIAAEFLLSSPNPPESLLSLVTCLQVSIANYICETQRFRSGRYGQRWIRTVLMLLQWNSLQFDMFNGAVDVQKCFRINQTQWQYMTFIICDETIGICLVDVPKLQRLFYL